MEEEPQHRERLWRNAARLWERLRDGGLLVPPLESPILPVFVGHDHLLHALSRDLFLAGVKCGNVSHPAVPRGEAILRFSVNARHTDDDLDRSADTLVRLAGRYGIVGLTREEIQQVGAGLPPAGPL
jgi:7-keto-8-aminopelargonate synthetase-like enzyme